MAKKATITPVTDTVNNASAINTQLNAINNQLDNTLSLDGSTPNAMNADIDLNSNDLLNGGNGNFSTITLNGTPVSTVFSDTPYPSRERAVAATIPASVNDIEVKTPTGDTLAYKYDATGTALTTAGGRTWSPDGETTVDHFAENTVPGTTDMASAFVAAFAYDDVVVGKGIYNIGSAVDGTGNTLLLEGSLSGTAITGDDFTIEKITAGYHQPHKVFGFRAKQSTVDNRTTTHTGTRSSQTYIMETIGSGNNGPSNADIPLVIEVSKKDYLTSAVGGEIDGQYVITRQGSVHDAGGVLIDARKVKGGSGGMVGTETLTAWTDATGAIIDHVQTIAGFAEGAGGFSGNGTAGFVAEPRKGLVHSLFAAIGRSDLAVQATWAFYAATGRPQAERNFGVRAADGAVFFGLPATTVSLRQVGTSLDVHNTAGTRIGRIDAAGRYVSTDGIQLSSDSDVIRKQFTATAVLDYPSIAAHSNSFLTATVTGAAVGDLVVVSPTNDYASGNLVFTPRVTAANTVTIQCQNISTGAINPGPQTLKIKVERFG